MARKTIHIMAAYSLLCLAVAGLMALTAEPVQASELPGWQKVARQDRAIRQNFVPPQRTKPFKGRDQDHIRDGVKTGRYVPLSNVLANIRSRYPGKQLNTSTIGGGANGPVRYVVLWLTPDGHRLDITADARTGRIINVRGQ